MFPGKRWIAGRSRNTGSRSAVASVSASIDPRRSLSTSGPENAFCTVTCWSSANPTSSAIGSFAISALASSLSVKYSASGIDRQPELLDRVVAELVLLDLAGDRHRQVVNEQHVARHLVVG